MFPFGCSWLGGSEEYVSYHVHCSEAHGVSIFIKNVFPLLLYSTLGMFCEGIIYFDVPSLGRYLDDTKARVGEFKRVIKRKMKV